MSSQQHQSYRTNTAEHNSSSTVCAHKQRGTQGECKQGHSGAAAVPRGVMALQAAEDRAVQRGEVFTQHLSREAFWKNKNMLRVWKCKLRVLAGTEYWRTGGNWAWGGKESKCRKLLIVYKHAKNMVPCAHFVCSKVSFTAKCYCLKDHRTFRRKEKPGLRLSKDAFPASAMRAIIWISH